MRHVCLCFTPSRIALAEWKVLEKKYLFKTKMKTSLRARGPPGVLGALCSVRILRIGRIGSGYLDESGMYCGFFYTCFDVYCLHKFSKYIPYKLSIEKQRSVVDA